MSIISKFVGIPFGHTGHVRFITCVDYAAKRSNSSNNSTVDTVDSSNSTPQKKKQTASSTAAAANTNKAVASAPKSSEHNGLLIISGGDGFEDFRSSGTNPLSDIAGREDSTNHLLLWQV